MLEPRELLESIDDRLRARSGRHAASRRCCAISAQYPGRSAARRPAGAAGHRRGAEPHARRRSKRSGCCRTSRPRSRSCCRSCWSASRTCATSWPRPSSSSCGSGSRSAITCEPLDAERDRQLHQPPAARAPRSARRWSFPREVTDRDPRPQPRRAAHHQRHLRRALVFGYGEERREIDVAARSTK